MDGFLCFEDWIKNVVDDGWLLDPLVITDSLALQICSAEYGGEYMCRVLWATCVHDIYTIWLHNMWTKGLQFHKSIVLKHKNTSESLLPQILRDTIIARNKSRGLKFTLWLFNCLRSKMTPYRFKKILKEVIFLWGQKNFSIFFLFNTIYNIINLMDHIRPTEV